MPILALEECEQRIARIVGRSHDWNDSCFVGVGTDSRNAPLASRHEQDP